MNGMRARDLLPWRTFVVETKWPPSVAVIEIRKQVGTVRGLLGGGGDNEYAPFVGTEDRGRFHISRRIGNERSVRPRLEVAVEPSHHDGSRVVVRVDPDAKMLLLVSFAVAVGLIVAGFAVAADGLGPQLLLALPIAAALGAALVVPSALEARESERLLREIFAAAPALPAPPETDDAYR
jgi:hypothetical protein